MINGFGTQHGDTSKEAQAICLYANYYKIPRRFFTKPHDVPKDWVAYGSVEWTDKVLGGDIQYKPLKEGPPALNPPPPEQKEEKKK